MKKHISALLADLGKKRTDYTPPIPAASTKGPVTDLDPRPQATTPDDLDNQILSTDQAERVRQLDYQAQRLEEEGTSEG